MHSNSHNELADLTERQLEILSLVSKGCSNADIAQLLEISPNTVKAHLASVLERLDVSNRTEASVMYQKHMNGEGAPAPLNEDELNPFIQIKLLYKNLSRTGEIAENLTGLVLGFEIFSVHTQASENLIDDSHITEHPFLIKIDDLSDVNASLQIALFSHDAETNQQTLLYKSDHSLTEFDPPSLIKHAVQIYRQILPFHADHQKGKGEVVADEYRRLCQALEWAEAINPDQLHAALDLCDQLLPVRPNWHLPYAIKAVVWYKLISNGLTQDIQSGMHGMAEVARKSLSLKPESSWSQLAFAFYCALSSDMIMTEKHLKASLKANPCQYRAKQLLGQILAFSGHINDSIAIFHSLLQQFPESEAAGSSYGALALVHYCAQNPEMSQKMAQRALLYDDAPKVPMILTLLAIAEQQGDEHQIKNLMGQLKAAKIAPEDVQRSLHVASKVVPADLLKGYLHSLQVIGVIPQP